MNKLHFSVILLHFLPSVIGILDDRLFNSVPRLPVWNGAPFDSSAGGGQRQMDFTQLLDMMGEPRGSRGRELSELITRPKPKCNRRIRVFNGVTRLRERGSLARFQCSHGFTLIGPTTIVCLRDRWSESPPICVRGGCRPLRTPENGEMRQSIGGAVVAFFCHGNAQLIGNPIVFCDGTRWNGTEPVCHVEPEPEPITTTTLPITTTYAVLPTEKVIDDDGLWPETELPQILQQNENTSLPEVDDFAWDSNIPVATLISTHVGLSTTVAPGDSRQLTTTQPESVQHAMTTSASSPGNEEPEKSKVTSPAPERAEVMIMTTEQSPYILNAETSTSRREVIHAITIASNGTSTTPLFTTTTVKETTPAAQSITFTRNTPPPPPRRIPIVITNSPPRVYRWTTKRPTRPRRPPSRFRPTYTKKPKLPSGGGRIPFIRRRKPIMPILLSTTTPASTTTNAIESDYPIAIDKRPFSFEQVEPIRPILPDQLNTEDDEDVPVQHASLFYGGIVLFIIGLSSFSAAVVFYCWRKNKGIARARPYDMDGRTLSAHDDANDDFMYIEQRDSRL